MYKYRNSLSLRIPTQINEFTNRGISPLNRDKSDTNDLKNYTNEYQPDPNKQRTREGMAWNQWQMYGVTVIYVSPSPFFRMSQCFHGAQLDTKNKSSYSFRLDFLHNPRHQLFAGIRTNSFSNSCCFMPVLSPFHWKGISYWFLSFSFQSIIAVWSYSIAENLKYEILFLA